MHVPTVEYRNAKYVITYFYCMSIQFLCLVLGMYVCCSNLQSCNHYRSLNGARCVSFSRCLFHSPMLPLAPQSLWCTFNLYDHSTSVGRKGTLVPPDSPKSRLWDTVSTYPHHWAHRRMREGLAEWQERGCGLEASCSLVVKKHCSTAPWYHINLDCSINVELKAMMMYTVQ